MKKALLLASIAYLIIGCNNNTLTPQETVKRHYAAFSNSDYNQIKTTIADSLTVISGDYVMPYNRESYYEVFKWDSVFQTSYKLVKTESQDDQVIASVTMSSIRNTFLQNPDMTCRYRISFSDGLMSEIAEIECTNVDWSVWQKEVQSLVAWIGTYHPELDGFIYDMTEAGATNYLKAIALYQSRKDSIQ